MSASRYGATTFEESLSNVVSIVVIVPIVVE
jgi:hypothetical protein